MREMRSGTQPARRVWCSCSTHPSDYRVSGEELWLSTSAKRFLIWGPFDDFILAELPAKELRAHVRRKGVVAESDEYKAAVLRRAIEEHLPRSCSIAP